MSRFYKIFCIKSWHTDSGVPTLGGARGEEQAWHPHVRT